MLCSACISLPPARSPVFGLIIITLIPPFPTDRDRARRPRPAAHCDWQTNSKRRRYDTTSPAGLEKDMYSASLENASNQTPLAPPMPISGKLIRYQPRMIECYQHTRRECALSTDYLPNEDHLSLPPRWGDDRNQRTIPPVRAARVRPAGG